MYLSNIKNNLNQKNSTTSSGLNRVFFSDWTTSLQVDPKGQPGQACPNLSELRMARGKDIAKLPETIQLEKFLAELKAGELQLPQGPTDGVELSFESLGLTPHDVTQLLTAGFATLSLHCNSRIASMLGQGFYTIGPCGEEVVGAAALALRDTDSVCLHYRHLSILLLRHLRSGKKLPEILLDRARGYVVSSLDPVTGGHHCSLGGGDFDFLNTSTLASQAPPAVGRALGASLSQRLQATAKASGQAGPTPKFPRDMVSFVSLGNGSADNAHFLAALNTTEYARHKKFKCPVVFAVTDNDLSISLKGNQWFQKGFIKKLKASFSVFEARADDALDV